jgi:hypothetical protein
MLKKLIFSGLDKQETWNNGSPFIDKGSLRAFLQDPLLKEFGNYST